MSQQDQHLTTEQLSASLDQQLDPQEQAQLDAHLETCEECQGKLADLRQTVALLHALPQPKLPRSFVLSLEAPAETVAVPIAISAAAPVTERMHRLEVPRSVRPGRSGFSSIRTTIRVMSTLAAMVGVVLLLSSLLAVLPARGGATASSAATGNVPYAASASQSTNESKGATAATMTAAAALQDLTPMKSATANQATAASSPAAATPEPTPVAATPEPTPIPTKSLHTTATNTGGTSTSNPDTTSPAPSPLDPSTVEGRALLGVILLVLSLCGLLFLRTRPEQAGAN